MKRIAVRMVVALALIGAGFSIGRAQPSIPDFELRIDAPEGRTYIECVRGCQLAWVERMVPGTVTPSQTTFNYACSNAPTARCESGRIGGWLRP
jgi:hypothetical protein